MYAVYAFHRAGLGVTATSGTADGAGGSGGGPGIAGQWLRVQRGTSYPVLQLNYSVRGNDCNLGALE